MTRQEMKAKARENLGNNIFCAAWMYALLGTLLYSLVVGLAGCAFAVGQLILVGPMLVGLNKAFLSMSREKKQFDIGEMFRTAFSNDFGRTLLLGLMKVIFITLWSMLFVIPGIVKSYSYAMAEYIAVDHPEYGWKECIDASKELMNGHKWELFVLDLSFIGWMIVGSLICGIGTLWVSPYMFASRTEFYRSLIGDAGVVDAQFEEI